MSPEDVSLFYPTSAKEWRKWLSKNHKKENAVWCVMYRKDSGMPSITWSEAVDEALCFGWIDSVKKPHDTQSAKQYFSKRKAGSTWSKINKDKVEVLIKNKRMSEAGLAVIERAKQDGTWTFLDDVEALIIPEDLDRKSVV